MKNDSRSRKWQITINNPVDKGLTHEELKKRLSEFKNLVYWCMSDEIGENKTYHTHLFIACNGAVRFSTIQKRFKGAHFEMANGTSKQNREYVFKEGKWETDKKKETNLPDTHEEYGDCPIERQGQRNDLIDLYDSIKAGLSNYDIIEDNPNFMFDVDRIERARQMVRDEQYKNTFRELEVTYIYGKTGCGKTRGVMEQYGYSNVFRITDYNNPFDSYKGQDVIIFEEFRSSLKIQDMLNYLDGYPLELPCRYANKIACFTKVYIITNIALEHQYDSIQKEFNETWNAFLRRIHKIKYFNGNYVDTFNSINEYFDRLTLVNDDSEIFKQERIEDNGNFTN